MALGSQRRTRGVWVLLAVTATAAAIDGALTWRQQRWNDLIVSGPLPSQGTDLPVQVQFAQAFAHAASGADDAALQRYRSLQDDSALGQAARYNSANLLLRQAVVVRA